MVPSLVLGAMLWLGYGVGNGSGWIWAKLILIAVAIGYQHACRALLNAFVRGINRRSDRWLRVFNEVSVLLFLAIVALVVVKPF
jgi:putative membrane protein